MNELTPQHKRDERRRSAWFQSCDAITWQDVLSVIWLFVCVLAALTGLALAILHVVAPPMKVQPAQTQREATDRLRGDHADLRAKHSDARKTLAEANWKKLAQAITDALAARDITLNVSVEALEEMALAHVKGSNASGWITPYAKDHPLSLLLQYQFISHHDLAQFIADLWSRQTGKDFSATSVAAKDCYTKPATNWSIFAPSERQSLESLDKGKTWAEAFGSIVEETNEANEAINPAFSVKSTEIKFNNGSKLRALPGMPHTVRGLSTSAIFTEADFFENFAETWKAALPSIGNEMRGGRKSVRIITTPNGIGGGVHKLWTKEPTARMAWSKRLVTIWHAFLQGCLVDPLVLREAMDDPDGWAQEYLCVFLDGSNVLLPYELIAKAESLEASEGMTPELIATTKLRAVGGIDFGRTNDPSVMVTAIKGLGMKLVQNISKLRGVSTPDQIETFAPYIDLCDRVAIDYTGPGIGFGDLAVKRWGEYNPEKHLFGKIQLVTFTVNVKRAIFPALRLAFERGLTRIPISYWLREDLHAMRQVITGGQYNYKAPHSDEGHSDGCTALALMELAAASEAGPVAYEPINDARDVFGNDYNHDTETGLWLPRA